LYPQFSKSVLYNYSTPLEQELESLMYFQHLEKLREDGGGDEIEGDGEGDGESTSDD
jgi:hypothetical protein